MPSSHLLSYSLYLTTYALYYSLSTPREYYHVDCDLPTAWSHADMKATEVVAPGFDVFELALFGLSTHT